MSPARRVTRAAKLHLRRRTHSRASGRVYWLRRAGRAVERVERTASGRSSWRDALDSHGAGPQDYTISLFFFPTDSPFSLSLSPFPPSFSLSRLSLSLLLSQPIVRTVGYNIQFIMYLWYMRTAAPEKWEARMYSRLPVLLPGREIKWGKYEKREEEKEVRKDERTRRLQRDVMVRRRTDGIGSVPLEGELSRYCRSGSSPLDKAPRSKRPPFWCSTGWRAGKRVPETEVPIAMSKTREWEESMTLTRMTMMCQGIEPDGFVRTCSLFR